MAGHSKTTTCIAFRIPNEVYTQLTKWEAKSHCLNTLNPDNIPILRRLINARLRTRVIYDVTRSHKKARP